MEEVLLPEAAVSLIMDDKTVNYNQARQIHLDSRVFGTVNHRGAEREAEGGMATGRVDSVKQEPLDDALPTVFQSTTGEPIVIDLTGDD